MSMDSEYSAKLIARLGGPTEVGRALGVTKQTVQGWRRWGIPWPRRKAVVKLAKQKGVRVTKAFTDALA